ncbi:MAG: hypothetical protein A3F17_05035 [Gammaproteobacteria bacterium RIFCSPHIGHO2_12_FULL_41_15]|nr:MAG: hypothetical protein A3F17_05035 [Gammaproteobacteria bacterium RIFCSPHIGHO2_12_FULL_41_15]
MSFITANQIRLYYEVSGEGEPLILIGGLASDHLGWQVILSELSRYFRVITMDNRGAGQSEVPAEPYTTQMMAEDVADLLQALNIPRAHVLGHSLGGAVAQQLAIHYPQKIHRLILCHSFVKAAAVTMMAIETTVKLMTHKVPLTLIAENNLPWLYSSSFLSDERRRAVALDRMLNKPHLITFQGYKNQAAAMLTHDTREYLCQITAPTLVLTGAEDILVAPEVSKAIAALLPQATLEIMANTAHVSQVEQPRAFEQIVLHFLK